jgi:CheY-like chemotaxis protein
VDGTGLGLANVKKLALLMDGKVGVRGKEGEGSFFWFTASLEPTTPELIEPREELSIIEKPTQVEHQEKIVLVVEDEPINVMIMEDMMDMTKAKYLVKNNGQEAFEYIKDNHDKISLVLMDCRMPVMDGLAATRHVRRFEMENNLKRIRIAALTANAFPEDKINCFDAGMDAFYTKPIDQESIEKEIQTSLEV